MEFFLMENTWVKMDQFNDRYVVCGNYLFEKYLDINKNILFYKYKTFKDYTYYAESRLAIKGANDKWGFLDRSGNLIVDCKYDEVSFFKNGIAIVYKDKYGIVDYLGNEIIPCLYDNIYFDKSDDNKIWLVWKDKNINKQVDLSVLVGDYSYPWETEVKIAAINNKKVVISDNMVVLMEKNNIILCDLINQIITKIRKQNFDGIVNSFRLKDLKNDLLVYDIVIDKYFKVKEKIAISDDVIKLLRRKGGII